MNRKIMNSTAICITVICLLILFYEYKNECYNANTIYSKIQVVKNAKKIKTRKITKLKTKGAYEQNNTDKKEKKNLLNQGKKKENCVSETNKKNLNRQSLQNDKMNIKKDATSNNKDETNINELNINEPIINETKKDGESKPVFKIAKADIEKKLNLVEKLQILNIIRKRISKEDYKKIEEYFDSDNEKEGVRNILKILRKKLNDKEYKKILKIASRFINMDVVKS